MTHLYIELNTTGIEEVNSSIIAKLYELASSGDLDNTSDLLGRLHSVSAKKKHVTYLSNNFNGLYLSVDNQYLDFEDPDVETYMKRYIGNDEGVTLYDVLVFVTSGTAFGANYKNTHTNRLGGFTASNEERASINSFDELSLFNGLTTIHGEKGLASSPISSITLPSSVVRLSTWAFANCTNLSSINLNNIQYIGGESLEYTNLSGVIDLSNVIQIGDSARGSSFKGCTSITEVNASSNFTTFVNGGNFENCTGLTKFTGLSNLTSIPGRTFYNCNALSSVDIDWNKITSAGNLAFMKCNSLLFGELDLSEVTTISQEVFRECHGITKLLLGNNVTVDGLNAFCKCTGMTEANLGSGITFTNNGTSMFSECTNLTTVTGLSGITTIPSSMFGSCTSLSSVDIDWSKITGVGDSAFKNCNNLTLSFGQNVNSVSIVFSNYGNSSFYNCTSLVFPQTITISTSNTISNSNKNVLRSCFSGCTLHDVIFDSSIKNISANAFENSHMESIDALYVLYITQYCFKGTDVTEIILPSLIGFIEDSELHPHGMFRNCLNLEKVVLGHITEINDPNTHDPGRAWFYLSNNMKTLDVGDSVTQITVNHVGSIFNQDGSPQMREYIIRNTTVPTLSFDMSAGNLTASIIMKSFGGTQSKIYVPDSALNDYKTANNWSIIASYIYPLSDIESTT